MKIISWNVNGIRAVERKEALEEFLRRYDPDVFFIQETKAKPEQLTAIIEKYSDYRQHYNSAEKPGYAGTSVWIKNKFSADYTDISFHIGMPQFADTEGRICELCITDKNSAEKFSLLGVYFPNGGKSPEAWDGKLEFYDKFLNYVNQLRKTGKTVIWTGDINCAHNEIDLARPESNRKSIGFLPEERGWIDRCLADGWTDIFRGKFPETVIYSWWHLVTRSRARNVGWRIDYFFCDKKDFDRTQKIEYLNDQMGSDHCPVLLEFE